MKFVSTRDLRNQPGLIRKLAQKEDLVLTANGKPVAVLIGVEEDDLEETTRVVRQARAQRAVSRMRREAARRGVQRIPSSKIEAEIQAARSQRKS
jgi:prevent-host-death family protein